MRIQSQQGFWSGVMFVAIGVFFSAIARNYAMGTSAAMGPGYLPFWLGVILAVFGAITAILALSSKSEKTEIEAPAIGVVLLVLGSVTLFGIILPTLGLYLSVLILIVLSSLASHVFNWKVALANAVFLAIFGDLVFVEGLGLVLPLLPSFL